MKNATIIKKILGGGAFLFAVAATPVIPQEMELLYSFQCPCEPDVLETATSTVTDLPLVVSSSDDAYSVFRDRNGNQVIVPITKQKYAEMGTAGGHTKNPKKTDYQSLFETAATAAEAAIARDSELYAQAANATSLTFSFTNTAGNVLYVFGHDRTNGATEVTGVTYNAVALSKIVELDGAAAARNDRAMTSWRLNSPATGANNVVVTSSASNNLRFSAVSYSGADTTTSEDGTNTNTGDNATSISTTITPTLTGCWMAMFTKDVSGGITYTNTTGDSIRLNADAGGHVYTDTNGTVSGANTITNTMSSTDLGAIAWTICPPQTGDAGYSYTQFIF